MGTTTTNANVHAITTTGRQNRTIMAYKGAQAFEDWLNGLAEAQGVPLTVLFDLAIRDYGRKCGAPEMPRRIPKRTPRRSQRPATQAAP